MVAHEWMKDQKLISRACHGQIALLDGKTLKRRNVVENADAIAPLIAFFGLRPTVDQIEEQVSLFFEMARPKGKPRATRTQTRTAAWVLRRLVSLFNRAAKRGHFPREPSMRRIYMRAEIPLPDPPRSSTGGSVSSSSSDSGCDSDCSGGDDLPPDVGAGFETDDGEAPEDEVSETLPELDDRLGSGQSKAVSPSGSDLKTPPPRPPVEPRSTEKLSIHRGDGGAIAKDHVAKKLDVGGVPTEQKSAESMEIESLLLEQALLEELLVQEELEIELAKVNNHFEREKSRVNSTISASSDVAPSSWMIDNLDTLPYEAGIDGVPSEASNEESVAPTAVDDEDDHLLRLPTLRLGDDPDLVDKLPGTQLDDGEGEHDSDNNDDDDDDGDEHEDDGSAGEDDDQPPPAPSRPKVLSNVRKVSPTEQEAKCKSTKQKQEEVAKKEAKAKAKEMAKNIKDAAKAAEKAAKAAARKKGKEEKAQAQAKAKAKAKAGKGKAGKGKAGKAKTPTMQNNHPHEEETEEDQPMPKAPRKAPKKSAEVDTVDAAPAQVHHRRRRPKRSRDLFENETTECKSKGKKDKTSRKKTPPAKAKYQNTSKQVDAETKALRSRKSSAYHVAKKKALKEGKSKEEANEEGKRAYRDAQ